MTLANKVAQFNADADKVNQITHGNDSTVVQTDSGPVRSLAKLIKDNDAAINATGLLAQVNATKAAAVTETNAIKAAALTETAAIKVAAVTEITAIKTAAVTETTAIKAASDIARIAAQTAKTAAEMAAAAALAIQVVGGAIGKTTLALLNADLAWPADKIAVVTNDAVAVNNTTYIKLGSSGAGSWQVSATSAVAVLSAHVDAVISSRRSAQWIHTVLSANKRIFFGIKANGQVWVNNLSAVALTITKTLGIGSLIFRPAKSAKYPLVYLAADKKTILGALDKDGYWFWRMRDLFARSLAIGSTLFRLQRSGKYPVAYLAADKRTLIGGVDKDGYWFWRTRPIRRVTTAASALFSAYTIINSGATNCKLFSQDVATGVLRKIVDGSAYYDVLHIVGTNIICRDSNGLLVTFSANGGPHNKIINPVDGIMCIGDSLTGGAMDGATLVEYPTRLKALIDTARGSGSYDIKNIGIGGQVPSEIAARFGGADVILTITGNLIPAMTTAGSYVYSVVTARNISPLTSQGFTGISGWINSIQVNLLRNSDDSYKVARAYPGPAVAANVGSIFIPDVELAWATQDMRQRVSILWLGMNGTTTTTPAQLISCIDGCIKQLKTVNARYLIPTIVTPETGAVVAALNAAVRAAYPNNVVEVRAMLLANGNNSTQDNSDIAAGNIPSSLRIDGIHLNAAGHNLVAKMYFDVLTAKGWI